MSENHDISNLPSLPSNLPKHSGWRYSLTKSSNPKSVPVNSRSVFIITHICDPIHLSISSVLIQNGTRNETVVKMYLAGGFVKPWRSKMPVNITERYKGQWLHCHGFKIFDRILNQDTKNGQYRIFTSNLVLLWAEHNASVHQEMRNQ